MGPLVLCLLCATIFFAIVLAGVVSRGRMSRATRQRLQELTGRGGPRIRSAQIGSAAGRRLFSVVHAVRARLGVAEDVALPDRLMQAGYRGVLATDIYNAARIVGPVAGLIAGSLSPWQKQFFMIATPGLAYVLPAVVLSRMIKRRREKIRQSIPDAVDLLVICVDSGLGIDQALLRVSQELGVSHPEITVELMQINREQKAGKPRAQAWADMAKRSELPDIDAFSTMLVQTERFGTPVARALSAFAEGLRLKRRQMAEEMAAKTTVKIIFPLVLFIFPSMFLVLLGPAVLTIMRGMSELQ